MNVFNFLNAKFKIVIFHRNIFKNFFREIHSFHKFFESGPVPQNEPISHCVLPRSKFFEIFFFLFLFSVENVRSNLEELKNDQTKNWQNLQNHQQNQTKNLQNLQSQQQSSFDQIEENLSQIEYPSLHQIEGTQQRFLTEFESFANKFENFLSQVRN